MKLFAFIKKLFTGGIVVTLPYITFTINDLWVVMVAAALSVISYIICLKLNIVVSYNDARAHMDMARLVFDNLKPGLAQMGSVWLPLDHVLKLALVWNYTLWQSGFAGSIWSMISFVGTSYVLYRFIRHVFGSKITAFLGVLLFATNLNVLYMQSTPMTELLLLFFFTTASYTLYKWTETRKTVDLIYPAFWVFLASLTRYDGWFLFAVFIGIILIISFQDAYSSKVNGLFEKIKLFFQMFEGRTIFFSALGGLGIVLWILWNWAIFKDPLYFAFGPYSAHAQQAKIAAAGSLVTQHNLLLSLNAYWLAMIDNVGFMLILAALCGLAYYIFKNKLHGTAIAAYSLLSPFAFHVIALFVGFSILVVPEMGVKITNEASASWFNVRYGLMILPAVAFFAAYLVRKSNILKLILFALIILQVWSFYSHKNVITVTDGVSGTSSLEVGDVRDWLDTHAKNKDGLILTSIAFNNALAFSTGIPLKRFIHEGTGDYWKNALINPQLYANWIVMANGDVGDQVYNALIKNGHSQFLQYYTLVFRAKHTNVYERKQFPKDFVVQVDSEFLINNKSFKFIGVNSYDLAYRSTQEIDDTMRLASENGVKVIRLWAFGDGNQDGFQTDKEVYSQQRIQQLGYVIALAHKYNIKLILTLSNYWSDYGGVPQYLKWANLPAKTPSDFDNFFSNSYTKNLYEQYVKLILSYKNPYTNLEFKDDPAIMAWELMNEPRSSTIENGYVITGWLSEMSQYVRSLDQRHIISLGTEGFSEDYNTGNIGPFLSQIKNINNFTLPTEHFYLQYEHQDTEKILQEWGKTLNATPSKPLVIGEVGFDKNPAKNNNISREILYKSLFDYAQENNINGVILWNWALKIDDSYGISPVDSRDKALIQEIKDYSNKL